MNGSVSLIRDVLCCVVLCCVAVCCVREHSSGDNSKEGIEGCDVCKKGVQCL